MDTNDGADQELVEKGQSAGALEKSPPAHDGADQELEEKGQSTGALELSPLAQTNGYDHWSKSKQMLGYNLFDF